MRARRRRRRITPGGVRDERGRSPGAGRHAPHTPLPKPYPRERSELQLPGPEPPAAGPARRACGRGGPRPEVQ